ncbi:MAG: Asp-tRNA(Asn)/Glu-tRNA(Gln) amidotransferase GatCAB subunit A [Gammaproteobacteria bacterium]|nr:Asp-tRNA(Asn)/Glu-tRNA(Gln) amidotransferase GatCAB subunit A [Gammaproteobacteria bacterium]
MNKLTDLTIARALSGLKSKEFSATELTKAYISSAEASRELNIYVEETFDVALQRATLSDKKLKSGDAGSLEGIPVAVKDLFCTRGIHSAACSKVLNGFKPPYESAVTEKLWDSGAILLGKANMDEFAMGSSNTTSYYGSVTNPWSPKGAVKKLVPGGSSGGSAAAVSARAALAATGTDTGGSIRQPASFCGVVGLKPTYGRCSRWGIIAFASSLDQAGPITRTVEDAALMLNVMAGYDPKDSTSVNKPVPNYALNLNQGVKGLRVGIPGEYQMDGMSPEIKQLWDKGIEWFKNGGAEVKDISLPHTKYALPTYYIVAPAEASSNLARYDGVRFGLRKSGDDLQDMYSKSRAEGFGEEVKRRVLIGTYVLSAGYYDAYYLQAQRVRTRIAEDFKQAFSNVDVILTPTAPSAAFEVGANMDDPISMYLNDIFTVPASLAGLPGISVPAGLSSEGLPLGLQIIGEPFNEHNVLISGQFIETAANFDSLPQYICGG